MEETEKHRSLLSDIVRFAGEGIVKGDNTLTRLVCDDAIDVDDIFFSRSCSFHTSFERDSRGCRTENQKASQQTQRLADDVEYECINQAAKNHVYRAPSVPTNTDDAGRIYIPRKEFRLKKTGRRKPQLRGSASRTISNSPSTCSTRGRDWTLVSRYSRWRSLYSTLLRRTFFTRERRDP